ncbi:MAG: tetratricopeptide repeat protein [Candidatus Omnitrophica bacterium]|nr:tetratricopeptide repeat protein [Candidatus Omnitrophota bacterium]
MRDSFPGISVGLWGFLSFFLLFQSPPSLFSQDASAAQSAFEEGIRFENEGNLLMAEKQFKNAIEINPANPDYHFHLANVYAMRHDRMVSKGSAEAGGPELQMAAGELEQAVMLRPDDIAALYNLGIVYKGQKRFEEAREQFRKVLRLAPSSVHAMMQIGASYEEQGFFDDAKDSYLKANEMDYKNPNIQAALHDLEIRRQEAHERILAETASSRLNSRAGLGAYEFYRRTGQTYQNESGEGNQNIQQALPYLGAMLVEQFLKKRSDFGFGNQDEE